MKQLTSIALLPIIGMGVLWTNHHFAITPANPSAPASYSAALQQDFMAKRFQNVLSGLEPDGRWMLLDPPSPDYAAAKSLVNEGKK
jgi:hypothetical protein